MPLTDPAGNWLDELDATLAETGADPTAEDRIRDRAMADRNRMLMQRSRLGQSVNPAIVETVIGQTHAAHGLAAPDRLGADVAGSTATGKAQGFAGGFADSFINPGLSMVRAARGNDPDVTRVQEEQAIVGANAGVASKLGQGVGTTVQLAPMLATGGMSTAPLLLKVGSQLPLALPIATGAAEEVADAHPVYDHGMELAGRIAQAASLGASRQVAMMAGGELGPKVSGMLAPAKSGLLRSAAAETAAVPAMSMGMTAAGIPGELALSPNGVQNVEQSLDPATFAEGLPEFASQIPIGLMTRRANVGGMRDRVEARQASPVRADLIAKAEAERAAPRLRPDGVESPDAKVRSISDILERGDLANAEYGELAPAQVAGEKARLQARAKLLADVDAQKAGEARNAEARNALAPDVREAAGIAAERERMQREQHVRDVAKQAEKDAAGLEEQEAAAREEGDLQTEASAREREAQLEAEAKANVERGGKLDAEKAGIADDEARISDLEASIKSKPSVGEQIREARTRIENEYLRVKSRSGDMQLGIGIDGVERPVDTSVLKVNRGEIVRRVRQEADAIRSTAKAEREQVQQARRQLAERKAAHVEAARVVRVETKEAKQARLDERRSVPSVPASVRNRSTDATIPAPEPRSTADRLKAILEARRDGRLTAEEAKAAAARVRAETSSSPTITKKEDSHALPSALAAPSAAPTPAAGPAGGSGAGNLPVSQVRAPGAGPGVHAAAGAAGPGAAGRGAGGSGQAGPAGVATPAAQHATRMAELDVQKREAEKGLADTKWKGSEIDRERSGIDVEYAAMRADAKGGVDKAKLADATAEQKQEASKLADTAVTTAEKRVALAKAKLDLVDGTTADPSEVHAAKEDLAETQIELTKARTVKVEADNLHRTTKRDIAEERNVAHAKERREHVERLLPDIERGARATFGKDVSARVDINGDVEIVDPAGNRKMLYRTNLEERPIQHGDLEGWWASAGKENIRAWLRGQVGSAAERKAGKAALAQLGGEIPNEPKDIRRILRPNGIVKFIKKTGVDAAYHPTDGSATLYNISDMLSEHAFNNAFHEGNHRGVHGILRLALAGKGGQEHLETMVKSTGIDPREPGKMLPFLEAVQRKYASFSASAAARASEAGRNANPSRFTRAMRYIGGQIRRLFSMLRIVRAKEPQARLSLEDVFKEIEAGKWRDVQAPGEGGKDAFATRVPREEDSPPPSMRETLDESRVGRAITRTGDWVAGKGKDLAEKVVGTGKAVVDKVAKSAQALASDASEIRRVDAVRAKLKASDPEAYAKLMRDEPADAFAARVPTRDVSKLKEDVANAETPEDAEAASNRLARADRSLGSIPEEGRGIAEQARTATKAQAETFAHQEKALNALIEEKGYSEVLADAVKRGKERLGRLADDERDIATIDDLVLQREMARVLDTHGETGRLDYNKFNDLMLAHSAAGEEAGRRLAFFRDRIETPAQRRGAARKALLAPSPMTMKELKKLDRRRRAAENRGDDAGARKAGELFDAMQERLISSQERRIARIKKATGLDLTDGATLDALLGNKDAFATNLSHLEDLGHAVDPKTNVLDWIISNQRAGMLSDIPTTQTQQMVSNLVSMLSGTARESLRRPGSVIAAVRGDLLGQIARNAIDSFKQGKNAFVQQHLNQELGRGDVDQYRNPTDKFSKAMRLISFDIMASIDGAAQRYNAQLEMSAIAYERARKSGKTIAEATKRATEELKSGMSSEDTVEAIYRSLPSTFQELSIMRPGTKATGIDKVIGGVTRSQTVIDEYLGKALGESVGWFRDKESGQHLPFPITKILLPFVRTPLAIANAAMRHSPAGLLHLRAAWKNLKAEKEIDGNVEWAKEEVWRRSYESILIGTILMHGLAYALDPSGTSGEAENDKTIEIAGRRIGYSRLEPFATPFAMAANGVKAFKSGVPLWEIPLHEVSALLKLGSDLSWFRLVSDLGTAQKNIDKESRRKDGDVAGKVIEEVGSGVTKTALGLVPLVGSRLVRGPLSGGDDSTKAEPGVVGYVKGEYGFGRSTRRNSWGEPVKRGPLDGELGGGVAEGIAERAIKGGMGRSTVVPESPVDKWLAEKGVDAPQWRPVGEDGKGLPPAQADAFIAKAGPLLKAAVERIMANRPDISAEDLDKAIDKHKRAISEKVKRQLR